MNQKIQTRSINSSSIRSDAVVRTGPARVVWLLWALMSISLLVYVGRYSHNVPYYDDWNLVPLLDGSIRIDTEWLWKQHNAHRIPFPKLVFISLLTATGWDFRSGMFLNALALIFITALLLRTSRNIRGSTSYTDLFFPLFLLHWGNFDYLLWNWQLNQMIPVIIVLMTLTLMLQRGLHPGTRALMFSSIGILLLPLSGVNGLAYTPGLAIWILLSGIRAWRSGTASGRLSAMVAQVSSVLSFLLIPVYFLGLDPSKKYSGEMLNLLGNALANLGGIVKTGTHFVAQGLGPGAIALAPFTSIIVPLLILSCLASIVSQVCRDQITRHFAIASILFLVGITGLISAVSISLVHNTTFPTRYVLQAAPIFCWMFLASARNKEFIMAKYVPLALVFLSAIVLYGNIDSGLQYAWSKDQQFSSFEADIQKGDPPSQVIAHHQRAIFPYPEKSGASFHDSLGYWLDVLRNAGHVRFANLGNDPVFAEVPAKSLTEKRFVYGIRVTGYPPQADNWQIAVSWKSEKTTSSISNRCFYWNPPPNPQDKKFESFTCWVYEEVSDIKIEVKPVEALALNVSLLVPGNH